MRRKWIREMKRLLFFFTLLFITEILQKWTWAEWKRPVIAVILTFLCNVESSMLAVGEWPYMNTVSEFYHSYRSYLNTRSITKEHPPSTVLQWLSARPVMPCLHLYLPSGHTRYQALGECFSSVIVHN